MCLFLFFSFKSVRLGKIGRENIMNYIIRELEILKLAFPIGTVTYIVLFLFLYVLKVRKNFSWKCLLEILFCIYSVALLKTTGIFTLNLSLHEISNFNIIPFTGSTITPVLLNWLLFVPYGFLMPFVFSSSKWNWRKAVVIGGVTSLIIEMLQLFGGRYAEIDDVLLNTLGTFSGYILFVFLHNLRKDRKKAVISLLLLCCALTICFTGIYFMGDNSSKMPEGLYAVKDYISEVNVYSGGKKHSIDRDSYVYSSFETQISNCGGHLLESYPISENEVFNDNDCYIEVIYQSPQTIYFENGTDFSIAEADKILYNADTNMLYWGVSDYQYYLDYTKLDEDLISWREQILEEYKQLKMLIVEY